MAIITIGIINVKEGKMEEAKEILKKAVPKVKESEPGTLEFIPHTFKFHPNLMLLFTKYEDESAWQAHGVNTPKTMAEFGPLLDKGSVSLTITNGELTSVRHIKKII